MKSLESCLRFGYPLLVQDVERIDPILNPVLNKVCVNFIAASLSVDGLVLCIFSFTVVCDWFLRFFLGGL